MVPLGCPAGTYQDELGQDYCKSCPAGKSLFIIIRPWAVKSRIIFIIGIIYQLNNSVILTIMTYNEVITPISDAHLHCEGFIFGVELIYCTDTILTQSSHILGYYCNANSTTYLDTECLSGRYCPLNTTDSNEFRCAAGTFNPSSGSIDITSCLECTQGMYCQGEGNSAPTSNCRLVEQ